MKSRHLPAMQSVAHRRLLRSLPWLVALVLLLAASAAFAQQPEPADPPGRVATVTERRGGVVFAPEGEPEWTELPHNRPLTGGDRVWNDRGARAELHLGSATLHLGGESHLGISALDDRAAQFMVTQGTVNARVRDLAPDENFEIDTPNLALRASQPGDFRIDVDADGRETRVVVVSGEATLYGDGGQAIRLGAGQQATFTGRNLAQVQGVPFQVDELAQWAAERNRAEDQSVAARHLPRGVVGYQQLDQHGSWSQDPTHGTVWYPRVTVADWAPYRYGHWSWVHPWGWTWVDDAPWGFAPFHYGRWAQIGSRWAWVPGRMVERPVYSPALVAFLGAGPAVGWYPLAPGEAWYPAYRASPRYLGFVNFNIRLGGARHRGDHWFRHRPHAITSVREDDFRRGRDVRNHWRPLQPSAIGRAGDGAPPARPDRRWQREGRDTTPRLQAVPRSNERPDGWDRARQMREWAGRNDDSRREQAQALREQQRLQAEAERSAREQRERAGRAEWMQRQRSMEPRAIQSQPPQQAVPIGRSAERDDDRGRRRGERDGRGPRDGDDRRGRGGDRDGDGRRGDDGSRGRGGWQR